MSANACAQTLILLLLALATVSPRRHAAPLPQHAQAPVNSSSSNSPHDLRTIEASPPHQQHLLQAQHQHTTDTSNNNTDNDHHHTLPLLSQTLLANGTARYTFQFPSGAYLTAVLEAQAQATGGDDDTKDPVSLCYLTVYDLGNNTYVADCDDDIVPVTNTAGVALVVTERLHDARALVLESVSNTSCEACLLDRPHHCVSSPSKVYDADSERPLKTLTYDGVTVLPDVPVQPAASVQRECSASDLADTSAGRWLLRSKCDKARCRLGKRTIEYAADHWLWHRPDCVFKYRDRFDVMAELNAKGIRKIVFLGDSLSRNTFSEMGSFFNGEPVAYKPGAKLFLKRKWEFNTGFSVSHGNLSLSFAYFESWTMKKEVSSRGSFSEDGQFCFKNANHTFYVSMRPVDRSGWYSLALALKMHPDMDLLVLNLGIHHSIPWFGFHNYKQDLHNVLDFLVDGKVNQELAERAAELGLERPVFNGKVLYRSMISVHPRLTEPINNARLMHYHRVAQHACLARGVPFVDVWPLSLRRPDRLYDGRLHVYPFPQSPKYKVQWPDFPRLLSNEFALFLMRSMLEL